MSANGILNDIPLDSDHPIRPRGRAMLAFPIYCCSVILVVFVRKNYGVCGVHTMSQLSEEATHCWGAELHASYIR